LGQDALNRYRCARSRILYYLLDSSSFQAAELPRRIFEASSPAPGAQSAACKATGLTPRLVPSPAAVQAKVHPTMQLRTPSARHLLLQCLKTQRPSDVVQFRISIYRGTKFTHAPFEPHHTQRAHSITTLFVTALPSCLRQHPVRVFLNAAAHPTTATASSSLRN
jgi:hypothetical protein